jgi:hypothetical protein
MLFKVNKIIRSNTTTLIQRQHSLITLKAHLRIVTLTVRSMMSITDDRRIILPKELVLYRVSLLKKNHSSSPGRRLPTSQPPSLLSRATSHQLHIGASTSQAAIRHLSAACIPSRRRRGEILNHLQNNNK